MGNKVAAEGREQGAEGREEELEVRPGMGHKAGTTRIPSSEG